jgi:2-keto-4-pentenoate hydratase
MIVSASTATGLSPRVTSADGAETETDAMVREMLTGLNGLTQIAPLTSTYGDFPLNRAYRIQARLAQQRVKVAGPVCGYKVAYASQAAQQQFGMAEPARGPLHLSQRLPSGSTLPGTAWNEMTLETEIGFTIGKLIDKPIADVAELKAHVKWLHTAFDAGNFPYQSQGAEPRPGDMVAIGTGAHLFVLGPAVAPDAVDIDAIDLSLIKNGELLRQSPSGNIMKSPWNSLLWCVNNLHRFGLTLQPGMVVVSGTAAPAYRVRGDEIKGQYVGDGGALGKVTMTIQ